MSTWILLIGLSAHAAAGPSADGTLRWNEQGAKLSWVLPAAVFSEADANGNRLLTNAELEAAREGLQARIREEIRLTADGDDATVSLADVGVEAGLAKRHKFGTDRVRVVMGFTFPAPPQDDLVLTVDLLGDEMASLDVVREGQGSGLGDPERKRLGRGEDAVALLGSLPSGGRGDPWPWIAVIGSLIVSGVSVWRYGRR